MNFVTVCFKTAKWVLVFCCCSPLIAQDSLIAIQQESENNSIDLREVPDSVTQARKKEQAFLYANDPSYWEEDKTAERNRAFFDWLNRILSGTVAKWVLYGILAIIVVFVIYQLVVVNKFLLFSRSPGKRKGAKHDESAEINDDLEAAISKATEEGNYRLAVRQSYLLTLKNLSDRRELQVRSMATNHDYLEQLKNTPRYDGFNRLTDLYEYIWYGEVQPTREQFDKVRNYFIHFNSSG
ncbi:MAG TPA: DUF4129 domain-containing protein [Chryseolinea sp.]|nr:DUF4129 domain-containing protein [Chryseolinea sp.]